MRRLITIAMALMMTAAMSLNVFAADITVQAAENTALRDAGLAKNQVYGLRVKFDREDGEYEVDFRSKKNKAKYSYEIASGSGAILEKSVEYSHKKNKSKKKIKKSKAYKAAAKASGVKLAEVKKGRCKYERDDGVGIYEIRFRSGNYSYEIELLARNGKTKEYSREMIRR